MINKDGDFIFIVPFRISGLSFSCTISFFLFIIRILVDVKNHTDHYARFLYPVRRHAMRQQFFSFLLFFSLFVVSGCSNLHVHTDFDPTADFSSLHTYAWKKVNVRGDALAENPLLYKRIVTVVDEYLRGRGYRETTPESADVLVVLRGGVKEKMRLTDVGGRGRYASGPWYHPWRSYPTRPDIVRYYTEGTLIIDFVDPHKNELIWRGTGTGVIHRYADREKEKKVIEQYVRQILDQFPPEHKPG